LTKAKAFKAKDLIKEQDQRLETKAKAEKYSRPTQSHFNSDTLQ